MKKGIPKALSNFSLISVFSIKALKCFQALHLKGFRYITDDL